MSGCAAASDGFRSGANPPAVPLRNALGYGNGIALKWITGQLLGQDLRFGISCHSRILRECSADRDGRELRRPIFKMAG